MVKIYVRILTITIAVFLIICGCTNPFSHRKSDEPIGSSGTWEVPSEPRVVISNLLYAYNERNINNFRHCISDSFIFSAYEDSIEAEQRGAGWKFHGWDADVEESVTRRIFLSFPLGSDSSYMQLSIDLSSNPYDEENDSTATLVRAYTLLFVPAGTETEDTTLAGGEATFRMSRSSLAGWVIDTWSDRPEDTYKIDWADFKALFR